MSAPQPAALTFALRPLRRRLFVLLRATSVLALAGLPAGTAQAQERPRSTSQALVVNAAPTDAATRERFGLVTIQSPEGSCSGSMLNGYWVITAAHCVIATTMNCPDIAADQITITVDWPDTSVTVTARQVIRYGRPTSCPLATGNSSRGVPSDVALLQFPRHGTPRSNQPARKIEANRLRSNESATAYGRGINQFAFNSGGTAVPTQSDGLFRSATFAITTITDREYRFFGNAGAAITGGDSGGPTYIEDWDDPLSTRRRLEWRLIGVHSWARTQCLAGQSCLSPNPWRWVSGIVFNVDANVVPLRAEILEAIEEVPPDEQLVGTFPRIPAEVLARKRALYALDLDEPLVAPPNAAIDVQLTFKRCQVRITTVNGCPVTPALEMWTYDVATHQIRHSESGRCLNISGGRRDPGAWIILYPCSGAPNEKWTIVSATSIWTIRSDHSGLCLQAQPAPAAPRGTNMEQVIVRSATLVQRPCNGSTAQQFADADSATRQRNAPR